MEINKNKWKESISQSFNMFKGTLPTILGVILLISLINSIIPKDFYSKLFQNNFLIDPIVGAIAGSVFAGNPLISYIIGGELLIQGIGLIAVTSFIVAWVTVGIIQFPAESIMLGKKFAFVRNLISFIFSILVAIITVLILNLLEGIL
jgi:uncharacterized membrane protein YraQ (UPF0718 family)